MKWLTFKIRKEPGFRLNLIDVIFIAMLCGLGVLLHRLGVALALTALPLYLGLSFFLFCNVFRIGNYLERFWYLPFTVVAICGLYYREYEMMWWTLLLVLEPLKWLLIAYRIKSSGYVGAGYRLLNGRGSGRAD